MFVQIAFELLLHFILQILCQTGILQILWPDRFISLFNLTFEMVVFFLIIFLNFTLLLSMII